MSKFEVYESNMWQVYLFVIVFSILAIFFNIFFSGLLVFEDGWIIVFILNIPFIFIVAPGIIYFYLNHARKRIVILDTSIEINTPLHSKHAFGWNQFDILRLNARGPHKSALDNLSNSWGRDYTKFKISFVKESNHAENRTIKFRIYNRKKALRVIELLYYSANSNKKEIEIDRKYI
jgi:hypothetical protein